MFNNCYRFKAFLLIIVLSGIKCHHIVEDYVSIESDEKAERNEIPNESIEEIDQNDLGGEKNDTDHINSIDEDNAESDTESTSKMPLVEVNVTSYNCHEKESSSEEGCKSTLINYPFSASIQKRGAHYASGALINRQFVLTSAAEFITVRETIKLFRVRLGSVDCKRGGVVLPIKRVEIHPLFVAGQPNFDVSLLQLAELVELTDVIKPIPLSKVKKDIVSAKFLTTYWPRLVIKGNLLPKAAKERLKHNSMRVSTQRLIPWKTCSELMRTREAFLDETSLCLKPITTHHSPCMPDVGAPVVADDGLWGITSGWTSKQCSKNPSPTVFTRTSLNTVKSWIGDVISESISITKAPA